MAGSGERAVPYVAPGEIYRDPLQDLQLPGSPLAFRLPGNCTGQWSSDGKTFKIFSDDRKVSCFLLAHGGAELLPAEWMDSELVLPGETLRAVGEVKRGQNETVYRFLEGPTISGCKIARTNRGGVGLHGSAAAAQADVERLRKFVREFVPSLRRPRAHPVPSATRPAPLPVFPSVPARPPAPTVIRDPRLRGLWYYSPSISSGSASMTMFRFRYFAVDGRFAQGGESYSTFVQGSGGQWAGMDVLHSRVAPGDRGTWETARGILTLHYEDNMTSDFSYYVQGDDLLLQQPGRDNQLWTRG